MTADAPWWERGRHIDRRPFLIARNRIAAALRIWFAERDFIEADPSALVVSPGNETHLHAFATTQTLLGGGARRRYLHTSPEFACKKLLAAGETRLFVLSHVFRNGEAGPLHAPEFTMLEWYRARETYERLMDDCAALLRLAAGTTGARQAHWRGKACDLHARPERLTLAEAFARHCGVDVLAADRDALAATAARLGLRVAPDDGWSDLFTRLLADRIEPHLGVGRPTILCDYPASEAALARRKPADPRIGRAHV